MISVEIYRIKKGHLFSENIEVPIDFGIISSNEGVLYLDLYVNDSYNLNELIDYYKQCNWNLEFRLSCITEENNKLEINRLSYTNITPHYSRLKMVCYGEMKHTENSYFPNETTDDTPDSIHYLIVEGLKMKFDDITQKIRSRGGERIKDLNDMERDHTTAQLVVDSVPYSLIFSKHDDSEDIVVEFPKDISNVLSYNEYKKIKLDFISVLSFLNGAQVRVRKEFTGSYYTMGQVNSEIVITYSVKRVINKRHSRYIPLEDSYSRSVGILSSFLLRNFDNYRDWNKKLDLNSIIFYLNNSEQSVSMDEKVFIQMIAFERISSTYAKYIGKKEEFLPPKEDYDLIKEELIRVVDKHRDKFGNAYNTVKSKIGNLNQIKRLSTTDKMYRILNDCRIPISQSIEKLIEIVRHETIHNGDIGEGHDAVTNFYLIDEIMREIILRLVDFTGRRNNQILFRK